MPEDVFGDFDPSEFEDLDFEFLTTFDYEPLDEDIAWASEFDDLTDIPDDFWDPTWDEEFNELFDEPLDFQFDDFFGDGEEVLDLGDLFMEEIDPDEFTDFFGDIEGLEGVEDVNTYFFEDPALASVWEDDAWMQEETEADKLFQELPEDIPETVRVA